MGVRQNLQQPVLFSHHIRDRDRTPVLTLAARPVPTEPSSPTSTVSLFVCFVLSGQGFFV